MRQRGSVVVYILLAVFFVAAIFVAYFFGKGGFSLKLEKNNVAPAEVTPSPSPNLIAVTIPQATSAPDTSVPSGWSTYKNEDYGFQISYPSKYKALTDSNNLYGWPKAVVLIYSGGQSYDLPIEVWNTQAEYEAKYKNQNNLTVREVNGKYITLVNANFATEVDDIISTFKAL